MIRIKQILSILFFSGILLTTLIFPLSIHTRGIHGNPIVMTVEGGMFSNSWAQWNNGEEKGYITLTKTYTTPQYIDLDALQQPLTGSSQQNTNQNNNPSISFYGDTNEINQTYIYYEYEHEDGTNIIEAWTDDFTFSYGLFKTTNSWLLTGTTMLTHFAYFKHHENGKNSRIIPAQALTVAYFASPELIQGGDYHEFHRPEEITFCVRMNIPIQGILKVDLARIQMSYNYSHSIGDPEMNDPERNHLAEAQFHFNVKHCDQNWNPIGSPLPFDHDRTLNVDSDEDRFVDEWSEEQYAQNVSITQPGKYLLEVTYWSDTSMIMSGSARIPAGPFRALWPGYPVGYGIVPHWQLLEDYINQFEFKLRFIDE